MAAMIPDSQVKITASSYGKTGVKLLYVRRQGDWHDITEYEVSTLLELNDHKDYIRGDNSSVVPTDTQKNTVYVVAQKYGVGCPEVFAMTLCRHFLSTYSHVVSARVRVETVNGWARMTKEGSQHRHAFISSPKCTRYAEVFQKRNRDPEVAAGLSGLRVLKTTQSSFVDFYRCPNTTLPDAEDRILSTVISAEWKYSDLTGVDYCATWELVQDAILDTFAGPPVTGIASPSVQLTLYDSERLVLGKVKQISEMKMSLPNVHYFEFDMGRFHNPALQNTKNVFLPTDKPSGIIQATLRRNQLSKL